MPAGLVALIVLATIPARAGAQGESRSLLVVTGSGEVQAEPDQAVLRIGAQVQAEEAADAQEQVNRIVQQAVDAIRELGVPKERIRTAGIWLTPVYRHDRPREGGSTEPVLTGYRASNTIEVRQDDLSLLGPVIDASVATGANKIEGISFQLRDDSRQRQEALRRAVDDARGKATALAEAADLHLSAVHRLQEGSGGIDGPEMQYAHGRMAMAEAGGGTPVAPGEITVHASVTIEYTIESGQIGPRAGSDPGRPR